jgi:hypothetical protein
MPLNSERVRDRPCLSLFQRALNTIADLKRMLAAR